MYFLQLFHVAHAFWICYRSCCSSLDSLSSVYIFLRGWCPTLDKAVQLMSHHFWAACNRYLLCLVCNMTINLSQKCIYFIFFKKKETECHYWLIFNVQLPATSRSPLQGCWLIGLSLWCIWLLAPKCNTKHLTFTACYLTNDMSSTISLPC